MAWLWEKGPGLFLLEEYESAKKKRREHTGSKSSDFRATTNGGDLILPNIDGITQTIRLGLKDADIGADSVDFISAHATATKMGDVIEAQVNGQGIWRTHRW